MGSISELKARVFVDLENRGFKPKMNCRVAISSVKGYQVINLDVVLFDPSGDLMAAFYIGPEKQRKLLKYKMTKVKFFVIQDEKNLGPGVVEFYLWYIEKYLK